MYSLRILFFSLPLYFSHVFSFFGLIIWESSSFERQKVIFFWILLIFVLIEAYIRYRANVEDMVKKYWKYIFGFLGIPLFSSIFFWTPIDTLWLIWSYEKHHGYIFFISLILLILIMQTLPESERKILIKYSLFGALWVASFAILEYLGIYRFLGNYQTSWETWRTISTLGNPNYVAGYLLMHIPLAQIFEKKARIIYQCILAGAIVTTGSVIAIFLGVLYAIYRFLKEKSSLIRFSALVWLTLVGVSIGYFFLGEAKLLSLVSRFILMWEIWAQIVLYPLVWILWSGPESILRFFDVSRSPIVNAYFPSSSNIDSSHNIILDFIFQYGLILFGIVVLGIKKGWKNMASIWQESFILGIGFLLFNPMILVHATTLILARSLEKSQK